MKNAVGAARTKTKALKASSLDVVDLLSSDDDEDMSIDILNQRPVKRRCSSLSSEDSPRAKQPASGWKASKPSAKSSAAALLWSNDSSDDDLDEILQNLTKKKKPAQSQTVIEIDSD